jgi:hypothetical protein
MLVRKVYKFGLKNYLYSFPWLTLFMTTFFKINPGGYAGTGEQDGIIKNN